MNDESTWVSARVDNHFTTFDVSVVVGFVFMYSLN